MAESKKLAFETGGHSLPQEGVNFDGYHFKTSLNADLITEQRCLVVAKLLIFFLISIITVKKTLNS